LIRLINEGQGFIAQRRARVKKRIGNRIGIKILGNLIVLRVEL